jgi:hypothetical protein
MRAERSGSQGSELGLGDWHVRLPGDGAQPEDAEVPVLRTMS